jgi:transposase
MDWARAPHKREQLVMFPTRLDEVIGSDHVVRLLDAILERVDWSGWEAAYDLTRGQPPIHPRVLCSVILYGLLTRIRSTRSLEESLRVRIDFVWLAEGRPIDHTTISKFRVRHAAALKDLFVQIGLMARQMGWLTLQTLAFDGTRIRANNRRSGTRTPAQFREMKQQLAARFEELQQQIAQVDAREEQLLGEGSPGGPGEELADTAQRLAKIDAALAELERLEQADQPIPRRLPLTDPHSRLTPNKEGGFAPNYTPLATVDVTSGLIVSADVIPHTDEDKHLIGAIEEVQQNFALAAPPPEMLADGMMATGENLAACAERNITLYSPLPDGPADNPAVREDPRVPVAEQDRDRLPTKTVTSKGTSREQLDKHAFVYDRQQDCYWCPQGKRLPFASTSRETAGGRTRTRHVYKSQAADCAECPLRERCLPGTLRRRIIRHDQHESYCIEQRERMRTETAQQKYAQRRHPGERPFAVIKQHFGARQFLTRGLERVTQEWRWLSIAFNLKLLIGLIRSGLDPPAARSATP